MTEGVLTRAAEVPLQPLYTDKHGTVRFTPNRIVQLLLDEGLYDLNDIAVWAQDAGEFTEPEQQQFAMLIGYSLDGFAELTYVSDDVYDRAAKAADDLLPPEQPAELTAGERRELHKAMRSMYAGVCPACGGTRVETGFGAEVQDLACWFCGFTLTRKELMEIRSWHADFHRGLPELVKRWRATHDESQ